MEPKLAYTLEEAAEVSSQGRTKVFTDIRSGKLRAKKNGRRLLILKADLETYLAGLPDREIAA